MHILILESHRSITKGTPKNRETVLVHISSWILLQASCYIPLLSCQLFLYKTELGYQNVVSDEEVGIRCLREILNTYISRVIGVLKVCNDLI